MTRSFSSKVAAVVATSGLAVGTLVGLAGPAAAVDTIATFAITGGSLSVAVPASTVALSTGTVNIGAATATAQLGSVAVTDNRGALVNTWTTTVGSTTFVTGAGTDASQVVAKANVAYSSGTATSTSGLGAFVPGTLASMATNGTGAAWAGLAGNNTAAWNPTLVFTLLSSQVAGTYTGTISHSVA
ncbi:MAG: hypothetical protein ACRD1K_06610 [Acidimicrobiales bacterium]